jgi:AraC family transcriptional regulator
VSYHGRVSAILREATPVDGIRLLHKHYAAGLRMGKHAHDEWRFCLALSGSYTDSWRRGYRTRTPRDLSLHPAGETHTSVFHSRASCFHIELTHEWRDRLLGDAGIAAAPQEFLAGPVAAIATQLYQELRRLDRGSHDRSSLDRSSRDRSAFDGSSSLIVEGLTCELIGWAARESGRDAARRSVDAAIDAAANGAPAWLLAARDLLHDRFNESLTLRDIAFALDVHPVHLARAFKRRFGATIGAYVRQLRVDFVRDRLPSGAPLADLAMQAGFADQSHLTRVFKQLTGCTPRQYRGRSS